MDWFGIASFYYGLGIYTKIDIKDYVDYGGITKKQYEEIVGEPYPEF